MARAKRKLNTITPLSPAKKSKTEQASSSSSTQPAPKKGRGGTRPKELNRRPIPKEAPVPGLTISSLHDTSWQQPRKSRHDKVNSWEHKARKWVQYAPIFSVNIDLDELHKRPKNTKKLKQEAQEKMEKMKDLPADAGSARFVDKKGQTLLCVFAKRKEGGPGEVQPYPGAEGRTLDSSDWTYLDSIPGDLLKKLHQTCQEMFSVAQPHAPDRDVRHLDEKVMEYEYNRGPISDNAKDLQVQETETEMQTGFERTGVIHLMHLRVMQGHKNGPFIPSSDFVKSCSSAQAVKWYFAKTKEIAEYLAALFQVAFPEHYQKYKKAFDAGVWEILDPGPWLGRVVVWKLQVKPHVDGLDDGPTASFNSGSYEGGPMYFTDIGVKTSYCPGDVNIFLSGRLYHAVGEWKPKGQVDENGVTPGRAGHVFFFPEACYEHLEGKEPFWSINTMAGRAPI